MSVGPWEGRRSGAVGILGAGRERATFRAIGLGKGRNPLFIYTCMDVF